MSREWSLLDLPEELRQMIHYLLADSEHKFHQLSDDIPFLPLSYQCCVNFRLRRVSKLCLLDHDNVMKRYYKNQPTTIRYVPGERPDRHRETILSETTYLGKILRTLFANYRSEQGRGEGDVFRKLATLSMASTRLEREFVGIFQSFYDPGETRREYRVRPIYRRHILKFLTRMLFYQKANKVITVQIHLTTSTNDRENREVNCEVNEILKDLHLLSQSYGSLLDVEFQGTEDALEFWKTRIENRKGGNNWRTKSV